MGFFGWDADGQPLHFEMVDMHEAIAISREAMTLWSEVSKHPELPAFTGGTQDAWPAWAVDALYIARVETERVRSFLKSEAGRSEATP